MAGESSLGGSSIPPTKKYGLILPGKKGGLSMPGISAVSRIKPKLFDEDDLEEDEDEASTEAPTNWVEETLKTQTVKKKQLRMTYEKALAEDPTIYQFDEVYDEIKGQRERQGEKSEEKAVERPKSRYIETLKKAAEKRNRERERRQERQIQKEREEEAGKYDDSEVFVTSAYRQKMEELQADAEKEKLKQLEDEANDVTKQKDLSGFYRHMYNETFNETPKDKIKPDKGPASETPELPSEPRPKSDEENGDRSSKVKSRAYRKRKKSESPEPQPEPPPEATEANLDADSDLDISEDEEEASSVQSSKATEKEMKEKQPVEEKETVSSKVESNDSVFKKPEVAPVPKKKIKKRDIRELFEKKNSERRV